MIAARNLFYVLVLMANVFTPTIHAEELDSWNSRVQAEAKLIGQHAIRFHNYSSEAYTLQYSITCNHRGTTCGVFKKEFMIEFGDSEIILPKVEQMKTNLFTKEEDYNVQLSILEQGPKNLPLILKEAPLAFYLKDIKAKKIPEFSSVTVQNINVRNALKTNAISKSEIDASVIAEDLRTNYVLAVHNTDGTFLFCGLTLTVGSRGSFKINAYPMYARSTSATFFMEGYIDEKTPISLSFDMIKKVDPNDNDSLEYDSYKSEIGNGKFNLGEIDQVISKFNAL